MNVFSAGTQQNILMTSQPLRPLKACCSSNKLWDIHHWPQANAQEMHIHSLSWTKAMHRMFFLFFFFMKQKKISLSNLSLSFYKADATGVVCGFLCQNGFAEIPCF